MEPAAADEFDDLTEFVDAATDEFDDLAEFVDAATDEFDDLDEFVEEYYDVDAPNDEVIEEPETFVDGQDGYWFNSQLVDTDLSDDWWSTGEGALTDMDLSWF